MPPATAHDLAFLAPGLVHQFGNLFLTIQGHSLHLDGATAPRAQPALLHACERGSATLRLVRHLLGDAGPERGDGGVAMAQLAELLRIPVREAGHALDVAEVPAARGATVDLASFVPLVVATVRTLVEAAPAGMRGVVAVGFAAAPPVRLHVTLRQAADSLPFPLALDDVVRQLRAVGSRRGWAHGIAPRTDGVEWVLPAASGVCEA